MSGYEVQVDLTHFKDRVGSRVAPGRYRVVTEDAEVDKSSNGNDMILLNLRIMGGEFDGSTIVDRLVLTEKSLFRYVGYAQAIGMQTPKKRLRIDVRSFINKVLEIEVTDGEPYMGKVKSEVRGYFKVEKAKGGNGQPDLDDVMADQPKAESAPDDLSGLEEFAPRGDQAQTVAVDAAPDDVDLDRLDLG